MPGGPQVRRGVLLAGGAALLFGATAPLLQRASAEVGALFSGSLLYLGAALGAGLLGAVGRSGETRPLLAPRVLGRLVAVAIVGGAVAPSLLVLGLRRTDAATASLLLALEAPFTLILARLFLGEFIGRRVTLAAVLIFAGGGALVAGSLATSGASAGALLVAAASLAWAVDNLLSRPLADQDAARVVVMKGLLGGAASGIAALAAAEPFPAAARVLPLLAVGAVGYGVSLQLYLRAQRLVGAARTASVFAAAPFVGVLAAFVLRAPWPGPQLPLAAALVGLGLWLHLSETHAHRHRHEAVEHDHVHRHDDGHHLHHHDPMPAGAHRHPHQHDDLTHEHEHSEDLHHRHVHQRDPVNSPEGSRPLRR